MRAFPWLIVWSLGCVHRVEPSVDVGALVREFHAANRPTMVDGVPRSSSLPLETRASWCARLTDAAARSLGSPEEPARRTSPCAVELTPLEAHRQVPNVRVVFDVERFFAKPYAAASFDRPSRTLFLPLAALERPWWTVPATRHEWRHALVLENAPSSELARALLTTASGPEFVPDDFAFDEVLTNVCDLVDAQDERRAPPEWQPPMTARLVSWGERVLGGELDGVVVHPSGDLRLLGPFLDEAKAALGALSGSARPAGAMIERCRRGP